MIVAAFIAAFGVITVWRAVLKDRRNERCRRALVARTEREIEGRHGS